MTPSPETLAALRTACAGAFRTWDRLRGDVFACPEEVEAARAKYVQLAEQVADARECPVSQKGSDARR